MTVKAIIAQSENNAIGLKGSLPWRISAELKHFKKTTMGGTLLVGSKTWASMAGINLGNRAVIVITSKAPALTANTTRQLGKTGHNSQVIFRDDIHNVLDEYGRSNKTLWVIGGKTIYEQAAPYISRVVLTRVHEILDGDTFLNILDVIPNLVPCSSSEPTKFTIEPDPTPNWSVTELRVRAYNTPDIKLIHVNELQKLDTEDKPLPERLYVSESEVMSMSSEEYRQYEIALSSHLGTSTRLMSCHPNWLNYVRSTMTIKTCSHKYHSQLMDLLVSIRGVMPYTSFGTHVQVNIFNIGIGGRARKRPFIPHRVSLRYSKKYSYHTEYLLFPDGIKSLSVKDVTDVLKTSSGDIVVINLPTQFHKVISQALLNIGGNSIVFFK